MLLVVNWLEEKTFLNGTLRFLADGMATEAGLPLATNAKLAVAIVDMATADDAEDDDDANDDSFLGVFAIFKGFKLPFT